MLFISYNVSEIDTMAWKLITNFGLLFLAALEIYLWTLCEYLWMPNKDMNGNLLFKKKK